MIEPLTLEKIGQVILQIEAGIKLPYPCDQKPSVYRDKQGRISQIITGAAKMHIIDEGTGQIQIFSPKVYQDCMNPKAIQIYTLKIAQPQPDRLQLNNYFETYNIELKGKSIEIYPWKAEIHKAGCVPCTNCGKCGW